MCFFIIKVQIMQDTKIGENIQTIYKNINKQLVQLVLQTPVPRLQTPDSNLHIVDSSVHTAQWAEQAPQAPTTLFTSWLL